MINGSRAICAAAGSSAALLLASGSVFTGDLQYMGDGEPNSQLEWPRARLRKHADYQRVYKAGRKQFSPSMSYFFRLRAADELPYSGPRVGLTTGRVLGKAVDRNRIKRRMREASRANLTLLPQLADVVLHPRRLVLEIEFARLKREVAKIFAAVAAETAKAETAGKGAEA